MERKQKLNDSENMPACLWSACEYGGLCSSFLAHLLLAHFCFTVKTKADGSFRLENITTGTYTIHVQKEHLYFETVTIKIAPNTPQLADIIATG